MTAKGKDEELFPKFIDTNNALISSVSDFGPYGLVVAADILRKGIVESEVETWCVVEVRQARCSQFPRCRYYCTGFY